MRKPIKVESLDIVVSDSLKKVVRMDLDFVHQVVVLSLEEGNLCVMGGLDEDPIRLANPAECEEMQTALHHLGLAFEHGLAHPVVDDE